MPHPEIDNETPFAFAPLFVADEENRPLLVLVAKATYDIRAGEPVVLADEQVPIQLDGEHWGEPEESSYKYEPETAWEKPGTDLVLIAHAWAPRANVTALDVGFAVGPCRSVARVFGDRVWIRSAGRVRPSQARPFDRLPLVYERAFGGWDRSNPDVDRHSFDDRNPVGMGFRHKEGRFEEGCLLPNIEDAQNPIQSPRDRPAPVGFGFTCPHWQPRAASAGTYDEAWSRDRQPLLPHDFDRRFFNAASPGLLVPGRLQGNEPVRGLNISKEGKLGFALPGQVPPECQVSLRNGGVTRKTELDTVIVNTDDSKLFLIWRAAVSIDDGPHVVEAIDVTVGELRGAAPTQPARAPQYG